MAKSRPTFVSLYSGAGGLDLGFVQAGFKALWANDIDASAVETHRANLGGPAWAGDISSLKELPISRSPDLLIGGPPCQGFSVAGHMRPDDPRSQHVFHFMTRVEELGPRGFVMENVASLALNRRFTHIVENLRLQATSLGYHTKLWVLNASDYGVPQARIRMFLVGTRDDEAPDSPVQLPGARPTVRGALERLPAFGKPGNDSACTAIVTPAKRPVMRKSPYAGMLFNGKGRALNLAAPSPTLPASMGGNRTPIIDQAAFDDPKLEPWIERYHRRLSSGKGPVKSIPKRMRRLTVEEAAVLQSFPSDWQFSGPQSAQFRQIGNSVPPGLAFHVALRMGQSFGFTSADPHIDLSEVYEAPAAA